jgi:hypothetical protein
MTLKEYQAGLSKLKLKAGDVLYKVTKDLDNQDYFKLRIQEELTKVKPDWKLVAQLATINLVKIESI